MTENGKIAGTPPADDVQDFDAIVVGAGFGGLYMLHRLRSLGLRVRVFEAGSGVGGTWYWNRYPGARCDVESLEYSYSFSEELQQQWAWKERYAAQPDILRYANHVADRFDLRRDIAFDTRVRSAVFDEDANHWTVHTDRGETVRAPFCIMAVGCLSLPRLPDFKGRDSFRGQLLHTGLWPAEGVDFSGRRVGVIGTGSSGIQVIPEIARQAGHLFVFQRTANFSLPARNRALDEDHVGRFKADYPQIRERARHAPAGIAGIPMPTESALSQADEVRQRVYEAGWERGSTGFTRLYKDLLTDPQANDTAADFVRAKIASIVRDPAVARALTPRNHFIGTKRICLDSGYFETYNRDNVTLVDVRDDPIEAITPAGLRTRSREFELDTLVLATGFDAITGALLGIDIRTSSGATLAAKWADGPRTYLGLMTAGFPNLFVITGPGSPSVLTNMISSIEQHVDWIATCLTDLRERGVRRIEADRTSEDRWVEHVNEVADQTLFPRADSWYVGANVPGKARVFMPYLGGLGNYRLRCAEVAARGYEGFVLQT
ncbi:MAG: NAD(P)/FAD-dependent oxidoreductase [Burkholderiales bacterium]|nr:NAD(P)/FAD-dependent oxidoreductase [Burkholderiales bacterium]